MKQPDALSDYEKECPWPSEEDRKLAEESDGERFAFGQWGTEEASKIEFDRRVESSGFFHIHREVKGRYLTRRINQQDKDARIDRVLRPTKMAIDAGWTHVIGVEAKRSGRSVEGVEGNFERTKIGRPLAQVLDYTQCAWQVGHYWMLCEYIFIWPFPRPYRTTESLMTQNCIGVIYEDFEAPLIFRLGQEVLRLGSDRRAFVKAPNVGSKIGSR